jgi:hypothetical protein
MFNLIPISLLIMALAGVIYIVSDHLSEFSAKGESPEGGEDEEDEFSFGIKAKLADWINQLPLDNVKVQSLSLTQKLLHKMRLILLKTDNHLMKLIGKISEKDKTAEVDRQANEIIMNADQILVELLGTDQYAEFIRWAEDVSGRRREQD